MGVFCVDFTERTKMMKLGKKITKTNRKWGSCHWYWFFFIVSILSLYTKERRAEVGISTHPVSLRNRDGTNLNRPCIWRIFSIYIKLNNKIYPVDELELILITIIFWLLGNPKCLMFALIFNEHLVPKKSFKTIFCLKAMRKGERGCD